MVVRVSIRTYNLVPIKVDSHIFSWDLYFLSTKNADEKFV
jgi:hypothetical protein